ncbi:helix-turn-helix transcriptional regulator [bacterium]|nr:helix-turn-helix transcriptional regulator [bacterium]
MKQTEELLITLKRYLRAKGITYKELSQKLGLGEPSIKRLFSKNIISLDRLEKICDCLDIDFYDLVLMMRQDRQKSSSILTMEQEQIFASDPKLVMFFYFLVNGWPLSLIIEDYDISENEAILMLAKLDEMGLVEFTTINQYRLLVSKNIFWQKKGPLWKLYINRMLTHFLNDDFDRPNDRLSFNPGQLSVASLKTIQKKIDGLVKQFNELAEMDSALTPKDRYSSGLIVGFRHWVFPMISDFKRKQ